MAMFQALVLFCVSGSTLAQIISTGKCPPVESQKDFNYTKFLGRWYQGSRYFSRSETGSKCNYRDYTPGDDDNPLKLTETFSYGPVTNLLTASRNLYLIDEDYPAELEAQFPFTIPNSPSKFFFVGTDYDNYAVTYSCTERGPVKSIYAWLEFRKRHPPKWVVKKAYKVLHRNNIDTSKFIKVDQTGCTSGPALIQNAF